MPTRFILIRHGETDANLKKKYISFTDIDLNDKGKKQAEKLCKRLSREKVHKVYSSDTKRALHFAKIAFKGFFIKKTAQLREMNFGIFEGLTHAQLIKKYPKIYKRWLDKPFSAIPKGENLSTFQERIRAFLKRTVMQNKNKTVAIVTHAGPMKVIVGDILKLKDSRSLNFDLGSLNIIEVS